VLLQLLESWRSLAKKKRKVKLWDRGISVAVLMKDFSTSKNISHIYQMQ